MPAFSSINVEPEESVEDEVETTKGLHIDDALKLFQSALKLHAQGPRFFDEASDAYEALFNSEIFKYPEAATDYDRAERQPEPLVVVEPTVAFPPGLESAIAEADGAASSLPQALYLSHKNRGQFLIDRVRHKVRIAAKNDATASVLDDPGLLEDAQNALGDLNAALDRDPSDAELWRRTGRVAAFLKSARINRYCLEAAVEVDDDPAVDDVEPSSLAEGFAGQQLRAHLSQLSDDMALSHPAMNPYTKRDMLPLLRRFLDPLPFLPDPTGGCLGLPESTPQPTASDRTIVKITHPTWSDLGMSLRQFFSDNSYSAEALFLRLPEDEDEEKDAQMEVDRQLGVVDAAEETVRVSADKPTVAETAEVKPGEGKGGPSLTRAATASESTTKERSLSLPTRKRSQSTAGIVEPGEDENGDTKRSKRIRRRDTTAEEAMDPATLLATQLQPFQAADENLFRTTKNILENLGVEDKETLDRIAEILDSCASEDRAARISSPATRELRNSVVSFDEEVAQVLLSKKEAPVIGLSTFLEHTKSGTQLSASTPAFDEAMGLRAFVNKINLEWMTVHDVAFEWVLAICPSYSDAKWTDVMKTVVVQLVSHLDQAIYERVSHDVHQLQNEQHQRQEQDHLKDTFSELSSLVQMLFELHLDVYERITNPSSVVEEAVRAETRGRLGRWFDIAAEMARSPLRRPDDRLAARFLWASVYSTTLSQSVSREHVLICWRDLRDFLVATSSPTVLLPNNAVMPEISPAAADQEISKLTTMDFFLSLFREEVQDPVSVIDSLEPVLNPDSVLVAGDKSLGHDGDEDGDTASSTGIGVPIADCASQSLRDLWRFLSKSSTELRLMLWSRLSDAYGKIKYTTKQFSCLLKGIEMVVDDLERESYASAQPEVRRALFMSMLKSADDLIVPSLSLALNDNSAFDIIDADHIRKTSSALVKFSCILHVAAMYEDEVRVGLTSAQPGSQAFLGRLREMQVRAWSLQYTVLKVGVSQSQSSYARPESDLADYLSAVHQVLGLRKCCKASNKIFLKMMRIELLKQENIENWEDYLGQVLYDLNGLKLGVGIWEVQDHACPPEKLEKRSAIQLVEKMTILATRMPMKDLLKSDLKATIEHIQQAIGQTKSSAQMIHNLRNFTEYLKRPIHPLRLYQALSGTVALDAVAVNTAESAVALHGWFFLLGMIALTKFKGVDLNRRQTPGATDDLRIGATFLRLQLQFTPDRWDAWFRLAECFDHELDEAVLWTADKMNKDRHELVKFQRNSIHCYTLALSCSHYWAADASTASEESTDALYEMYHKFGMRLYASSREPFAMEPFQHADHERFFIGGVGSGTFKKILHDEMTEYKVWKFAAGMFRKAMAGRPKDWKNPYMLAKCLWKMFQHPIDKLDAKDKQTRPGMGAVIAALEKAVQVAWSLPKPRHGQDPILEPHYKILSVVHKLVMRSALPAQEGAEILQRQPYAIQHGEAVTISDVDDWDAFAIKSLRHLRDKDKSNWQHRMIIRHARILFDEDDADSSDHRFGGESDRYLAAKAAFMVLRESMFTKTMVMNVWKCDAERAGRHHVYTEQYIRLMVRLLVVMHDRANMEALLRRIRKKGADFYHFTELWQSCVVAYLRLLRKSYDIPATEEDVFKAYSPEEFDIVAERIEDWVSKPEHQDNRRVSAMREAIELKKLNANLMKAASIDDLISDCYYALYVDIAPFLPGPDPATVIEDRNRARNALLQTETATDLKVDTTPARLLPLHPDSNAATSAATALGSLRAPSEGPEKMERQASGTGEPTHRGRRTGVRRPDIMRKAEQAVARAAEGPPKSAGASAHSGKSRLGSTSSGKNPTTPNGDADDGGGGSDDDADAGRRSRRRRGREADDGHGGASAADNDDDEEEDDAATKDGGDSEAAGQDDGGGDLEEGSSPPGSLHDSADDESDLSDVPPDYEEDVPPALMFPNLSRRSQAEEEGADGEDVDEDDREEGSEQDDDGDENNGDNDEEMADGDLGEGPEEEEADAAQ